MFGSCIESHKKLLDRDLLHRGNTDDLEDFPEGLRKVEPVLGDGDQKVGTDRRPDLDAYTVEGSAVKSPQSQVLFDPAKEQLDGPAAAVDLRDHQGVQLELVGEEDQRIASLRIHVTDPAKFVRIVPLAHEGIEFDGLIGAQAGGLVDRATLRHVKRGVRFEPGNEEGTGLVQAMEASEVQESSIHHVIAAEIHEDLVQRSHFVPFSLVQTGKGRN